MAKKSKDKKIPRLVLLGALEKAALGDARQRKALIPIITDLMNRFDPDGKAHEAFMDYQERRLAELESAGEVEGTEPSKKGKKKKKATGPKYKSV